MEKLINCPYCGASMSVEIEVNDQVQHLVCDVCHKPIALYPKKAQALLHTDRAIKAISLEDTFFAPSDIYLEFLENEFAPRQALLVPEGKSMLGRYNPKSSAHLQVMTSDPSMDRNHSVLTLHKNGSLSIQDNDSMTGTFVNGLELDPGEVRRLWDADVLTLGATSIIVHLPSEEV